MTKTALSLTVKGKETPGPISVTCAAQRALELLPQHGGTEELEQGGGKTWYGGLSPAIIRAP